jgi:hypothetical protein
MRSILATIVWKLHVFRHRHFCKSCRTYRNYLDWE